MFFCLKHFCWYNMAVKQRNQSETYQEWFPLSVLCNFWKNSLEDAFIFCFVAVFPRESQCSTLLFVYVQVPPAVKLLNLYWILVRFFPIKHSGDYYFKKSFLNSLTLMLPCLQTLHCRLVYDLIPNAFSWLCISMCWLPSWMLHSCRFLSSPSPQLLMFILLSLFSSENLSYFLPFSLSDPSCSSKLKRSLSSVSFLNGVVPCWESSDSKLQ